MYTFRDALNDFIKKYDRDYYALLGKNCGDHWDINTILSELEYIEDPELDEEVCANERGIFFINKFSPYEIIKGVWDMSDKYDHKFIKETECK